MLTIIVCLLSVMAFADGRNVIGNVNKLSPDSATQEVKRETKKLRDELNNLDKPLDKPIEKTPNQIIEERKQKAKASGPRKS